MKLDNLRATMAKINAGADSALATFVNPMIGENGQLLSNHAERTSAIVAAMKEDANLMQLESLGDNALELIASATASSIEQYVGVHGAMPRAEELASGYFALADVAAGVVPQSGSTLMTESLTESMSKSDGAELRNHTIALVMPLALMAATNDLASIVPAGKDKAEIFRVKRFAGSNFGNVSKDTEIDNSNRSNYANSRWLVEAGTGDGTEKVFAIDLATDTKAAKAMPIKANRVTIVTAVDGAGANIVARSNDQKQVLNVVNSDPAYAVNTANTTINATTGAVSVEFNAAPAAGVKIKIGIEIDFENMDENDIPTLDFRMESVTIEPHELIISSEQTIQAIWAIMREHNIDIKSMNTNALREYISHELDVEVLNNIRTYLKHFSDFDCAVPADSNDNTIEHLNLFVSFLADRSNEMMIRTKYAGIKGLYVSRNVLKVFSLLPQHWKPVAGYTMKDSIHKAGTFAGYDVYVDPYYTDSTTEGKILAYGRGNSYAQTGYIKGTAVPPTVIPHTRNKLGKDGQTLITSVFSDIHPMEGQDYFEEITLENIDSM